MESIPSFKVNHLILTKGVYVSRKDSVGDSIVTTFDIRVKQPNFDFALRPSVSHTIEHLGATFLRNHGLWKDKIIYFGPMGCLTGFYLIVNGDYEPNDIIPLMIEMFDFISKFEGEIPGATPIECGNYELHDLESAKEEGQEFLDFLFNLK